MEIKKGISQMAEYPNVEINYVVPKTGNMHYVLKDGELQNGVVIATLDPRHAIDEENNPCQSIGVFSNEGDILVDFNKKKIERITDDLLLVVNSKPETREVLDVLLKQNDEMARTIIEENKKIIIDNLMNEMGENGEMIFEDPYSEANVYATDSYNNKLGLDCSFIGKNRDGLFFHTNDINSTSKFIRVEEFSKESVEELSTPPIIDNNIFQSDNPEDLDTELNLNINPDILGGFNVSPDDLEMVATPNIELSSEQSELDEEVDDDDHEKDKSNEESESVEEVDDDDHEEDKSSEESESVEEVEDDDHEEDKSSEESESVEEVEDDDDHEEDKSSEESESVEEVEDDDDHEEDKSSEESESVEEVEDDGDHEEDKSSEESESVEEAEDDDHEEDKSSEESESVEEAEDDDHEEDKSSEESKLVEEVEDDDDDDIELKVRTTRKRSTKKRKKEDEKVETRKRYKDDDNEIVDNAIEIINQLTDEVNKLYDRIKELEEELEAKQYELEKQESKKDELSDALNKADKLLRSIK